MVSLHSAPSQSKATLSVVELKHSGGFTLVELMVTIVVASVLATIALPSYRELVLGHRIQSAASDFYMALIRARSEAMKRNAIVSVERTGTSWSNGWTVQSGGVVLQTQDAFDAITIDGPATSSLRFGVTGRPLAGVAGSTFTVYSPLHAKATRCVSLGLNGMPRIVQDTDDNPLNGC